MSGVLRSQEAAMIEQCGVIEVATPFRLIFSFHFILFFVSLVLKGVALGITIVVV